MSLTCKRQDDCYLSREGPSDGEQSHVEDIMTNAKKTCRLGFDKPLRAVIIGGRGGVGEALATLIHDECDDSRVIVTSRAEGWVRQPSEQPRSSKASLNITDSDSVQKVAEIIKTSLSDVNCIINCSGVLHDGDLAPERTWRHLDRDHMKRVFDVNTFGVALLIKHLMPLLVRRERSVFASLSARVGSIGDNRLGGWYSYRASKAAQNMMLKCAAIEAKRMWRELICVALHPGTVNTDLSAPFTSRTPPEKLFSAEKSAGYLANVIANLTAEQTGGFFAWDGSKIQY